MKDGSPNKAMSASGKRFARRPRAFCCALEVLRAARLGSSGYQAIEHAMRDCCSRAQARQYPASHVDRLRRQDDAEAETETGAVIHCANGRRTIDCRCCRQSVEKEPISRSARAVSA